MWQVLLWIFAVIGVVFSFLYTVFAWFIYYAFKISSSSEGESIRLREVILWPLLALMLVSEMVDTNLRRKGIRIKNNSGLDE